MRHFYLKAEVEATSAQFHLATPEVLHLLIMQVIVMDLTQNTGGSPMSGISMFYFTFLSYYNSSVACSWDTLLDGASTHSIHVNIIENHYASTAVLA